MPGKAGRKPRGSVQLCDLLDMLGEQIAREALAGREARKDGFTDPDESRLLDFEHARTERILEAAQARSSQQDGVFRMIQIYATTGELTEHTERQFGYAISDQGRLLDVEERLLQAA